MQHSSAVQNLPITSKYVLVHMSGDESINSILKSGQMKTGKALQYNEYADSDNSNPTYHEHIFFSPVLKTKTGKFIFDRYKDSAIYLDPFIALKNRVWYSKPEWGYGITYGRNQYVTEYFISPTDPNGNSIIEAALDSIFSNYDATRTRVRYYQLHAAEIFIEPDDLTAGTFDIRPSLLYPPIIKNNTTLKQKPKPKPKLN